MPVRRGLVPLLVLVAAPLAAQPPDTTRRAVDSSRVEQSIRAALARDSVLHPPAGSATRLTRQQALDEALARNPTLVIAREQLAQARARVTQAVALPEPQLGATVLGQPGILHPHQGSETDLSLGITVPFPNKFALRGAQARGDVGNFEQLYIQQRQAITVQTNQAYDSLLVSLRHREDLVEARALAQDFRDRTQARFNAGTAPRLDVIKAQVGVAQAENDLIANERGIANARAALNRLLGRVLGAGIEAADSLTVPAAPPDLARLERIALAQRPELRALASQRAGARAATRLAEEYWLPDIGLSVSRNNVYGNPLTYSTGIGLSIPLFPWQHQTGEVAEARHREAELAATFTDLRTQVGQDLRNSYSSVVTTLRQVVFIRDELLPSTRHAYQSTAASYSLGGASALDVLDARRDLLAAQTQYSAALAAVNDAIADLERASGAPLTTAAAGATR